MGDVINLRQARKRRDRATASQVADENRAKFGRTKAERLAQQKEAARSEQHIEGARRESRDAVILSPFKDDVS